MVNPRPYEEWRLTATLMAYVFVGVTRVGAAGGWACEIRGYSGHLRLERAGGEPPPLHKSTAKTHSYAGPVVNPGPYDG